MARILGLLTHMKKTQMEKPRWTGLLALVWPSLCDCGWKILSLSHFLSFLPFLFPTILSVPLAFKHISLFMVEQVVPRLLLFFFLIIDFKKCLMMMT